MALESVHLVLKPYSPKHLLALVESSDRFEECFGVPLPERPALAGKLPVAPRAGDDAE